MDTDPRQGVLDLLAIVNVWLETLSPLAQGFAQAVSSNDKMELATAVHDELIGQAPQDVELRDCLFHPDRGAVGWHRTEGLVAGYCHDCLRTLKQRYASKVMGIAPGSTPADVEVVFAPHLRVDGPQTVGPGDPQFEKLAETVGTNALIEHLAREVGTLRERLRERDGDAPEPLHMGYAALTSVLSRRLGCDDTGMAVVKAVEQLQERIGGADEGALSQIAGLLGVEHSWEAVMDVIHGVLEGRDAAPGGS